MRKKHITGNFSTYAKKNLLMNLLIMKIMARFDIIVTTQEIIEVSHIINVI